MAREKVMQRLKKIAQSLGVPFAVNRYKGPAHEFAVYMIDGVDGRLIADNRAQYHIASVQFHYVMPNDRSFEDKVFQIIDLMRENGFAEPRVVVVNDENSQSQILQFSSEIRM